MIENCENNETEELGLVTPMEGISPYKSVFV